MAEIRCPECGTQVEANDFACSNCQLILNATSATGLYQLTQPSIVRALLSPAEFSQVRKAPKPPKADHIHEKVTVKTTVIMDEYTIPKLTAGLDVALQPLLPFEAQVASYLDGRTSVPEVARLAALSTVETHAVLRSLLQRRVIELHRVDDPERAARGTRPPPRDEEPTDPASASGVRRTGGSRGRGESESGRGEPAVAEPARPEAPPPLKRRTTTSSIPVAATPVPSPAPPPVRRRTTTSNVPLTANPPTIPSRPTAPRSTTQNQIPAQPPPKPLGELLSDVPTPTQARDALKPLPPAPPPPPPPDDGTVEEQQAADERAAAANKSAPLMDPNAYVLERAIALERDGDVGKAIDTLKRAISKSKDPAPIYNKLALIVLDQRRDYRQAEELLQQAVDLDPSNPVYRQNLLMVIDLIAEQPPKPPGFFGKLLGRKER